MTFCGVNAHHQNGIAEWHIWSLTKRACSMFLPAMILWPDIISEQLWPFQQGPKLPRWKPHSPVGVYLGSLPTDASSVLLALSTTTGLISPQFHVVYDDNFVTTTCLQKPIPFLTIGPLFYLPLVPDTLMMSSFLPIF